VVGEIRDKRGYCRGFVPDTVKEFQAAGAQLYNDAVFIQPRGTLPLRVPRQFMAGRKMGRNHQSVLVFWKGDREPKAEDWAGLTERSIGLRPARSGCARVSGACSVPRWMRLAT
jgi:hypothetical protein